MNISCVFPHIDDLRTMQAVTAQPTKRRSLGAAILISAVEDYRSDIKWLREDAARLLYPETLAYKRHLDWLLSTTGIDPLWLREALDAHRVTIQ